MMSKVILPLTYSGFFLLLAHETVIRLCFITPSSTFLLGGHLFIPPMADSLLGGVLEAGVCLCPRVKLWRWTMTGWRQAAAGGPGRNPAGRDAGPCELQAGGLHVQLRRRRVPPPAAAGGLQAHRGGGPHRLPHLEAARNPAAGGLTSLDLLLRFQRPLPVWCSIVAASWCQRCHIKCLLSCCCLFTGCRPNDSFVPPLREELIYTLCHREHSIMK